MEWLRLREGAGRSSVDKFVPHVTELDTTAVHKGQVTLTIDTTKFRVRFAS